MILEKLIFQGKAVALVCHKTQHSPEAVLRYSTNLKQVLLCHRRLTNADIAFATKLNLRLIEEYQALIAAWGQATPPMGMHRPTLARRPRRPTRKNRARDKNRDHHPQLKLNMTSQRTPTRHRTPALSCHLSFRAAFAAATKA
jgi:hypothetical protein